MAWKTLARLWRTIFSGPFWRFLARLFGLTDARIRPGDIGYIEDTGGGIPALTWDFPDLDEDPTLDGHYCVFYVNSAPVGVPTQARDRLCAFPDADKPRPLPGATVRIRCYGGLGDEYSDDYLIPGEPPAVPAPKGLRLVFEGTRPVAVSWESPITTEYVIRAANAAGRPLSGQAPAETGSLRFGETIYAGESVRLVATHRGNNEQTTSTESLRIEQFEVSPPVTEDNIPAVTRSFDVKPIIRWEGPKIGELSHGDAIVGWLMDMSCVHTFHVYHTCNDVGGGLYEVAMMGNPIGVPFRLVLVDVRGAGGNAKVGVTAVFRK